MTEEEREKEKEKATPPTRLFRFYASTEDGDTHTTAILRAASDHDAWRRGFAMLDDEEAANILLHLDGGDGSAFWTVEELADPDRIENAIACITDNFNPDEV